MEAGFKEEVDGNYRCFVLHIFHQQAKLQLLTSDAETLAIFRLCDTSKSGSISARVSWRCNQREIKKINVQCDHVTLIFFEICLLPLYLFWNYDQFLQFRNINLMPTLFKEAKMGVKLLKKRLGVTDVSFVKTVISIYWSPKHGDENLQVFAFFFFCFFHSILKIPSPILVL